MSPEVFHEMLSPKADVWALGVILFEFTTGQRPFRGDNPMALFKKVSCWRDGKSSDRSLQEF